MSEDKPAEAKDAPKEDSAAKEKEAAAAKEKDAAAAKEKDIKDKEAAAAKEKEAAAAKEKEAAAAKEKEAAAAKEKEAAAEAAAAKEKEAAAAKAKATPKGAARGKLLLVAWGPSPAAGWEPQLAHAGFEVYVERGARLTAFQWANDHQPAAAVIDLSQNPDDGKRLASTLRITAATAGIPLVFCDALAGGAAPLTSVDAVLSALSKL